METAVHSIMEICPTCPDDESHGCDETQTKDMESK